MASAGKVSKSQRKDIRQICRYFEKNKDRMHYNEYLEKGYPIASGVIEGACRHLVKDRLERTGMNWTMPVPKPCFNYVVSTSMANGRSSPSIAS